MVSALGTIIDPDNVPSFTRALENDDGIVRLRAAAALARYGYIKDTAVIQNALDTKDRDVRLEAIDALPLLGDDKTMSVLETLLNDSDDVIQVKAAGVVIRRRVKKQK
jgi:HEAT repeat protein